MASIRVRYVFKWHSDKPYGMSAIWDQIRIVLNIETRPCSARIKLGRVVVECENESQPWSARMKLDRGVRE